MKKNIQQTYFWYDLETFGINPHVDRIAQFAGIRTDMELNPIEDPIVLYCKISSDFLPDPISCLVTGITPQETLEKGICENEFITNIFNEFSQPGTCVVGFNSMKFDDEFIRYALYRNLLDPYVREYANGNSRWDIINLVRMTHDLRPDGIEWPVDDAGKQTFRLEKLTQANHLSHEHAHDALSDVYATIDMARLILEKQPKLYHYLFNNRKKQEIIPFMDIHKKSPFLYTSPILTTELGCTSILVPLAIDYKMRNKVYCFDLKNDPTPLFELSVEELHHRIFTSGDVLTEEGVQPIRIISIQMNQAPAISSLNALRPEDAKRLQIDVDVCMARQKILADSPDLSVKLLQVFSFNGEQKQFFSEIEDPDFMLYSGNFFLDVDRDRMVGIRLLSPEKILGNDYHYEDSRLYEMVWRFVCRNYPEVLDENEQKRWKSFCAARLLVPPVGRIADINFYMRKISEKLNDKSIGAKDKIVLTKLLEYGKTMQHKILDIKE